MEHLQSLNIFRQRGSLVDNPFELLVLFFNRGHSYSILPHEFLSLKFYLFCKLGYFLILEHNSFVEIGPQVILSLLAVIFDLIDLIV